MRAILVASLLTSLVFAGCAAEDPPTGQFALFVTDEPDDIGDFSALNVTVTRIELAGKDNKSAAYEPASRTFDLTTLVAGNVSTLFNGSVAAGDYKKLDLFISEAKGTLAADGSVVDVKVPSGRIFLNTDFTVAEGQTTEFLFDVQVHQTGAGEYQLKPNADGSGPGKKPKDK